ncbi:hypothetical protein LR48_Vigan05g024700 [Vigna angularis]|uniref:Uncharacterized protein n=1 Tax=Phaseolus angularis TaxID=3914 RepID=A0A0L9UIQ1_PHAAN|nr:hypothetical protein LR48_Vigan05g024700 [Vigna angularis]
MVKTGGRTMKLLRIGLTFGNGRTLSHELKQIERLWRLGTLEVDKNRTVTSFAEGWTRWEGPNRLSLQVLMDFNESLVFNRVVDLGRSGRPVKRGCRLGASTGMGGHLVLLIGQLGRSVLMADPDGRPLEDRTLYVRSVRGQLLLRRSS